MHFLFKKIILPLFLVFCALGFFVFIFHDQGSFFIRLDGYEWQTTAVKGLIIVFLASLFLTALIKIFYHLLLLPFKLSSFFVSDKRAVFENYIKQIKYFLRSGALTKAEALLKRTATHELSSQQNSRYAFYQGLLQLQKKEWKKAQHTFHALTLYKQYKLPALYKLFCLEVGMIQHEHNDNHFDRCLFLASEALKDDKTLLWANETIFSDHVHKKKWKEALKMAQFIYENGDYDQLTLWKKKAALCSAQAYNCLKEESVKEAFALTEEARYVDPNFIPAICFSVQILLNMKEFQKAAELFSQAWKVKRSFDLEVSFIPKKSLIDTLTPLEIEKFLQIAVSTLEKSANIKEDFTLLSRLCLACNNLDRAYEYITQLRAQTKTDSLPQKTCWLIAQLYEQMHEYQNATIWYKRGLMHTKEKDFFWTSPFSHAFRATVWTPICPMSGFFDVLSYSFVTSPSICNSLNAK